MFRIRFGPLFSPRVTAALRLLVIPAFIAIAVFVGWRLGYFELDRRQAMFQAVQRLRMIPGIELVFIAGFAVIVALCLPANIGTMLAGAVFGTWMGAGIALAGGLLATVAAYGLARTVARRPVTRLFGDHPLMQKLRNHDGIIQLFQLRVVPVAPFAVLAYLAGIAGASLRNLVIATAIGGIAGCTAYAFAGSALMKGILESSDASRRALIMAGSVTLGMLLMSFVIGFIKKRRAR
jgi:uncharacterized membrane protein YdjX (TVP38/TMEM64 family)